jgi:polyhydroxyalkanoate synthase
VLTNPELLRETLGSNGENLVRGMHMLAEDIEAGGGDLKIRQSSADQFEVGRNLAVTPGKVIYQNELMQLIQYEPSTPTVLKRPLLIVPPWINKFYVLDLTPEKSFIKWAVDQGNTVFVISWVNPDARLKEKSFEDYMREGTVTALDVIKKATGENKVNAIGYCVGGTLLAITLAYKAAKGDQRIASATFFAAQVDFTHAGDLKVFVDEDQLAAVERRMNARGYLEGKKMANAFNLLRSNDLALRHQQLPARQGALPVRPVVLEFGRDPHAGGEPLLLSAQLLSQQPAHQGRDGDRRRHARPEKSEDPDL